MDTSMEERSMEDPSRSVSIIWYRHGLRMHDNPALIEALKDNDKSDLLPLFIFDGESGGTKIVGYNRMRFLIESLEDLNESLNKFNNDGSLRILRGDPVQLFAAIHQRTPIRKLCFEQDHEPIWKPRDSKVRRFCQENGIQVVECVSHTLWDPSEILEANGGTPPLTHAAFLFVVSTLPKPPRPLDAPDPTQQSIRFYQESELPGELAFPITPETFGVEKEDAVPKNYRQGGEQNALDLLHKRLIIERAAFEKRRILPNHSTPDLTMGISMSPALRFGNISVRKVYWAIQDLFNEVLGCQLKNSDTLSNQTYVGQLFWREYFYVMSIPNPYYDQMKANPICLNIPWSTDLNAKEHLKLWKEGRTG